MKNQLLKAISLIMAVSLLCSCAEQNVASSSVSETESKSENSIIETTGSEETSKIETSGTTIDSATTSAPETEEMSKIETTTTTKVPETEATTEATEKPEGIETSTESVAEIPDKEVKLDVVGINGFSDLASGSGITAAATILGYYGIDIKPLKLKEYAEVHGTSTKVDGFTPSPWDVIVDEPIGPNALYYAKPIIDMIHNYLDEIGNTTLKAKDVSGATLDELKNYIDNGKPVAVWATTNGHPASDAEVSWILPNGELFVAKNHVCVYTLKGYNKDELLIVTHTGYELKVTNEIFLTMYESVYSQAIIIE